MTADQTGLSTVAGPDRAGDDDDFADDDAIRISDREVHAMPARVLAKFLGVPVEDQPRFRDWADALTRAEGAVERVKATQRLHSYLTSFVQRRRSSPEDDLTSRMAADEGSDGRLLDPGVVAMAMLLFFDASREQGASAVADQARQRPRRPNLPQGVRRGRFASTVALPPSLGLPGPIERGARQARAAEA